MTLKLHTKMNMFGKGIFLKMKTAWKVILSFWKMLCTWVWTCLI